MTQSKTEKGWKPMIVAAPGVVTLFAGSIPAYIYIWIFYGV